MNYLIFEDFSGNEVPIIFPERILHEEMREQIPYGKVLAGGYVYFKKGNFICKGKVPELHVTCRNHDSEVIASFFSETGD